MGEDTVKMIWAFSDSDPANENQVAYHGAKRGTRSVFLLGQAAPRFDDLNDADTVVWDIKANNVLLPEGRHTHYWCQLLKAPDFGEKKHQIIGV